MNLVSSLGLLQRLKLPVISTGDAAGALNTSHANASKILSRLQDAGQTYQITRKYWTLKENLDPLVIPEYLSIPWPSYISLQTALFYHGMLSQIPRKVTAVSLSRTKSYQTSFGEIELRHIDKSLFCGFELVGKYNLKLATPEKAIVDLCYLRTAPRASKGRLPELEIPQRFSKKKAEEFISKINSKVRRLQTHGQFEKLVLLN